MDLKAVDSITFQFLEPYLWIGGAKIGSLDEASDSIVVFYQRQCKFDIPLPENSIQGIHDNGKILGVCGTLYQLVVIFKKHRDKCVTECKNQYYLYTYCMNASYKPDHFYPYKTHNISR